MADLPIDVPSMVEGLGYFSGPALTTDAASTAGADANQIPDLPQGQPSPLQAVSLATKSADAPTHGSFLMTNLHDDNWLDPSRPNISPESQKG